MILLSIELSVLAGCWLFVVYAIKPARVAWRIYLDIALVVAVAAAWFAFLLW